MCVVMRARECAHCRHAAPTLCPPVYGGAERLERRVPRWSTLSRRDPRASVGFGELEFRGRVSNLKIERGALSLLYTLASMLYMMLYL